MDLVRISLLLFVALLGAASAQAQDGEALDPRQLLLGTKQSRQPFQGNPAVELLTTREHADYQDALAARDCARAEQVLSAGFLRSYPEFRRAKPVAQCNSSLDCRWWRGYAEFRFHEYGYCAAVVGLAAAEDDLRARGITPPRFIRVEWPEMTTYDNPLIERRDERLSLLINKAEAGFLPAWETLADLVSRGDVFNVGPEIGYFVLKRACARSAECVLFAPRIRDLRSKLTADRVEAVDQALRAGPAPLDAVLRGEPLVVAARVRNPAPRK